MPISTRMRASAGLGADVSDAAAEAAVIELATLGRHCMGLTGAARPDEARGAIEAKVRDAAAVPGLREQLAAASAAAEESTRIALLEKAIAEGRGGITPALAFTFSEGPDGKKVRALSAWASPPHKNAAGEDVGQTLAQLRSFVANAAPLPGLSREPAKPSAKVQELADSDDDIRRAATAGLSVEAYRAGKAAVATARRG